MTRFDVTPEQASHGRVVPDRELPNLAAEWLVEGYDSPLLRDQASLNAQEALQGTIRLADVLAELGFPIGDVASPYEDQPWRGQWEGIWWAVDRMDQTHSPYASAQYVLEILGDVDGLWEPGGGEELMTLLRDWKDHPEHRNTINDQLRAHSGAERGRRTSSTLIDARPAATCASFRRDKAPRSTRVDPSCRSQERRRSTGSSP